MKVSVSHAIRDHGFVVTLHTLIANHDANVSTIPVFLDDGERRELLTKIKKRMTENVSLFVSDYFKLKLHNFKMI